MMKKSFISFLLIGVVLGCPEHGNTSEGKFAIEPKYALKDCLVMVNFAWEAGVVPSVKEAVIDEIIASMREATVVTHKLPLFFGHTTREKSYFVFYYTDKCEDRAVLTESFIDEFVKPNAKDFPKYSVISEGIEPGFDGVTPSGPWIPEKN